MASGLQSSRQPQGPPDQEDLHFYSTDATPRVKRPSITVIKMIVYLTNN
jgi:hypothetical protein